MSIDWLISYLFEDPLRLLYLLGGSGGVWFWIEKWTKRTRIKVRILSQQFDLVPPNQNRVDLRFEAVNIGAAATSLMPTIECGGFTPERREMRGTLNIRDEERMLSPHSTQTFRAVGEVDATYPWWLYKRYKFALATGWSESILLAYDATRPIGRINYSWYVTLFIRFGWLPTPSPRGFGD